MARHVLKGPGDMFTIRRVLAFWAAVLVITVASGARAQTTTTGATLTIVKTGITHSAPRSANRTYEKINRADCVANDVMTFAITASNFSAYAFQAWVGTQDCTVLANRTVYAYCKQVLNTTFAQLAGTTTSGSTTVQLRVRDLLAAYLGSTSASTTTTTTGGTGGTAGSAGAGGIAGSGGTDTGTAGTGGATTTVVTGGAEVCDQAASTTVVGATAITVYFMLVDPSTADFVVGANFAGTFKLTGPQPPDTVSAGIGGNLLVVNFSYSSAVVTDATRNGFSVYCDPPPGSAAAADAGLVDDSGVGSAVACPGTLTSSVLVSGENPPTDGKYKCGSGAITSTTANASNLVNGVPYNVAVAAIDTYENTGPLSSLACQVPQPITGFYKAYRDAGGTAGGGFCSISNKREPILLLAVLGLASCLMLRRRRSA